MSCKAYCPKACSTTVLGQVGQELEDVLAERDGLRSVNRVLTVQLADLTSGTAGGTGAAHAGRCPDGASLAAEVQSRQVAGVGDRCRQLQEENRISQEQARSRASLGHVALCPNRASA